MRKKIIKNRQSGFSLIEVMIAGSVMMVVIGGSMSLQSRVFTQTTLNNDRAFASEKATQMFEELRSFVQSNRETDIAKLQNFSDGSNYSHVLTTEKRIVTVSTGEEALDLQDPGDAISGNTKYGGEWKFLRQVQVKPIQNDPNARYVSVKVWLTSSANANQPAGQPLASIAGVLKTNITEDAPTQVYDLYLLALENSPSWWVDLANLRPSFERTLLDLEQRNPGLTFRRHFINRYGFGRDPYYMPYINNEVGKVTANQLLPWTYLYPGAVTPTNGSTISESYVYKNIAGRFRTDLSSEFYPISKEHPNYPDLTSYHDYALADQFNHVLRFPEQIAMEQRLVEEDPKTYRENTSLVTFLHRLNEGALRNAIIVNLHGELLPVPPLRNFSDAAKAPDKSAKRLDAVNRDAGPTTSALPAFDNRANNDYVSLAYKRVVAHPERLRYDNDSTVAWRVYAYEELRPGTNVLDAVNKSADTVPIISLFLPTIGKGPRYNGMANDGFLNYPDLDLPPDSSTNGVSNGTDLKNIIDALNISKIVGSDNQKYEVWQSVKPNDLGQLTYTHDATKPESTFIINDNSAVSVATANIPVGATSILVADAWLNTAANRNRLLNTLIVFDGGKANEEVVRIESVAANPSGGSGALLTFQRALVRAHNQNVPITRHKDFDVEIVNEDMFTANQRGIRILLYDTPTRHPQAASASPASNSGLASGMRLDGLEYIPAPLTNNGAGLPGFSQNLTNTTAGNYKNTARWQVELMTDAAVFGGAFNYSGVGVTDVNDIRTFPIETRFGTTDYYYGAPTLANGNFNYRNANAVTNCSTSLAELCDGRWGDGDLYVPNDPSTNLVNEHKEQLRPNLYNVSRSFIYMNREFTDRSADDYPALRIPKVEQAQFMGNPLLTPYIDVKQLVRYNRHYRSYGATGGISGYADTTGPSWAKTSTDMNWFFQLYSSGIMRSNAVYNSISGYSNYYYSLGGELGGDASNSLFNLNRQPWQEADDTGITTGNNSGDINEIIDYSRVVASTQATTPGGAIRWRARHQMGELFPDSAFEFWLVNGNLPSNDYNNSLHSAGLNYPSTMMMPNNVLGGNALPTLSQRYFRIKEETTGDAFVGPQADRRMAGTGAPSFMNGSSDPITSPNAGFAHESDDAGIATLTSGAGQFVVNAFNLNLNETLPANRPYILDGGGGSGAYAKPEFKAIRNRLSFINNTTGVLSGIRDAGNTYYDHSSNAVRTSSAMIRLSRPDPADTSKDIPGLVGYALVNGIKNASGSGVQEMARFAQASSLQTYMDAGDRSIPGSASGRAVQLPRVQITQPNAAEIQEDPSDITVQYQVDWLRWDGKPYSPAYPANWYDSVPIMYNVKYSPDNKRSWRYANNGDTVPAEFVQSYNSAYSLGAPASTAAPVVTGSYTWSTTGLPSGNYVFRIEVYREGYTQVGYSYHDVFVTIER